MKALRLDDVIRQYEVSRHDKILLVLYLSLPAILAQLTSIAMQYIDAGMVGHMGAEATAAIGLVSSSTWLIGGSCIGISAGFYVQVAQLIGAGRHRDASDVLRQGLTMVLLLGIVVAAMGAAISPKVPQWLGGEEAILNDASAYFRIYCLSVPFILLRQLCAGMMQATGDMKTPSMLSASVCFLDVIFNMLLIFPARSLQLGSVSLMIPGAGLKVVGAALGTALSELVISLLALFFLCAKNEKIALSKGGSWQWKKKTMANAAKIAIPMSFDQIFMCSAYVAGTFIVAKLGTVSVAANSLAVTAESLCYMPAYGIGAAATAIIGQSIGAGRRDLTRSFSRITVYMGMLIMGVTAVLMYLAAPLVFGILTSSKEVASLGTEVLRLELFAEPLYGASICCAGVFRGAGDTLKPSIMNLVSMWGVRILMAAFLVGYMGLKGYWLAMMIELCFRGAIFLIRLYRGKWLKKALI